MTTTSVLHSTKLKSTQISGSIHGNFYPKTIFPDSYKIHQLCLNVKDHLEFYAVVPNARSALGEQTSYELHYINKYEIYGRITSINRYRKLSSQFDSVVVGIDNNKLCILEYDYAVNDMKTLCLYAIDPFTTSGKMFSNSAMSVITSLKNGYILYIYDDNKMNILTEKKKGSSYEKESYYNTVGGDKYFEPTIYISLYEKKFVYKIIKIFFEKSYNEALNYDDTVSMDVDEDIDSLSFYLLYQDSLLSSPENIPMMYTRTKVNIALVTISLKTKEIIKFDVLWENIDEMTFDFFVLDTEPISLILFSPYQIQLISPSLKRSSMIVLNSIYQNVNYPQPIYTTDTSRVGLNIDLRSANILILSNNAFIFTTSTGELFFFTLLNASPFQYDLMNINGSPLSCPLNSLLMPYPGLFFVSSFFSDASLIQYDSNSNSYTIQDTIANYSPIINFHLINDNKNMKIVFTAGYGKRSSINFVYDKMVYYEIQKKMNGITYEFSFIKSIRFDNEAYSKYLICKLKNGNGIIFENNGKEFDNITDRIVFEKEYELISCANLKIENLNTMSVVVIVTSAFVHIFNPFMVHIYSMKIKDIFSSDTNTITKCDFGFNHIILSDETNKKIIILSLHSTPLSSLQVPNVLCTEKKINNSMYIRIRDISTLINTETVLKLTVNSKPFASMFTFIIVYRVNQSIDIYDVNTLIFATSAFSLCHCETISELPMILSSDDYFANCSTDLSVKSTLNVERGQNLRETPETIFFDVAERRGILCILFKNGTFVVYDAYIAESTKINFKKIYVDYLHDIDYKEFFMMKSENVFVKFTNVFNHPGILFNLPKNQKFIFDIKGKISILDVNNLNIKHSFSCFTEYSNEEIENGFLIFENDKLKHCSIPKNYTLDSNNILIRRNFLNRFPVTLNYIPVYSIPMYYCYILIEKEFSPLTSSFKYYLTLRTEDPKIWDEVAFNDNEVVNESRIVDLPTMSANQMTLSTKKMLAIGVNIVDITKDERNETLGKVQLYDIENGKFIKIYDGDAMNKFRGTISMIHSIERILVIGEGSKIYLYQYIPSTNEMKKLSEINNKTLISCSKIHSKHLIIGDLLESISWMVFTSKSSSMQIPSIDVLGKDNSNYHSTSIDFWIDQDNSGCILCDDRGNGHVFLILKEERSMPLVEICDFHLGKVVNEIRWWLYGEKNNNNVCYYGSDDGSVGYFIPIKSDIFERLMSLCELLYNHLPYRAGTNPKKFFGVDNFPIKKEKGRFIDMRMLKVYLNMPIAMQEDIAKKVLCDRETMIKSITDLIV